MTQLLGVHTHNQMQKLLADFMPNGDVWALKNVPQSVLFNLLLGLSKEDQRIEQRFNSFNDELQLPTTDQLISFFENEVGIPDSCFNTNVSLAQRIKQVQFKYSLKAATRQDFINIANFWGFQVQISNAQIVTYPIEYPMILTDYLWAACTLYIDLPANLQPNRFPLEYPMILSETVETNFIECLFEYIKNAKCRLIFRYTL